MNTYIVLFKVYIPGCIKLHKIIFCIKNMCHFMNSFFVVIICKKYQEDKEEVTTDWSVKAFCQCKQVNSVCKGMSDII